jgi:hypothetical protein
MVSNNFLKMLFDELDKFKRLSIAYCTSMYEMIRTFSPIFRGQNYENPRAAAIYYVNLIINFPTNLGVFKRGSNNLWK